MKTKIRNVKITVDKFALILAIVYAIPAFFIGGVFLCEMEGVPNPAYLSWDEERKNIRKELRVIAAKKVRKRSNGKWGIVKLPQEELKREAELLAKFKALGENTPSDTLCPANWEFCIVGLASAMTVFVITFHGVRFIGRKVSNLLKRYIGKIEFDSEQRDIGGSDGGPE